MYFKTLGDRMSYYRDLTDYKLSPNLPVIMMLDGRSFSKKIKNFFQKPFDNVFVDMMDETAKYLYENIEGCKIAYTQSDEISLVITDYDNYETNSWFGYRISKMLSIGASLTTAKFNQLLTRYCIDNNKEPFLIEFDCKVWNVPSYDEVVNWFKYRQRDCIKNSKQQFAQSYVKGRKSLNGLTSDEQIELVYEQCGKNWTELPSGLKYGRFFVKTVKVLTNIKGVDYTRTTFDEPISFPLDSEHTQQCVELFASVKNVL